MKKLSSILIAFAYLMLSVGIAKSTHYCMGRPLPSKVFSFESKKCICEETKATDSCCDDEIELVKIENDQSLGQVIHSPLPEFTFISELFQENIETTDVNQLVHFIAESHLPPPKIPLYQVNCSLIFYESLI